MTLKDLVARALDDADNSLDNTKVASVNRSNTIEARTPINSNVGEVEKLASSLDFIALNLTAIETPPEVKLAEFQYFLQKMAEDGLIGAPSEDVSANGLSGGSTIPNDMNKDITLGQEQAYPVAMSNTVLPKVTLPVAVPGTSSPTAMPTDDAGLLQFHGNTAQSPLDEGKIASIARVYSLLKLASDVDNPAHIDAVPNSSILPSSPDGLGQPVGGWTPPSEWASNEAAIAASPRALADANKAQMLQFISEGGQDPTIDAMLEHAKEASFNRIFGLLKFAEEAAEEEEEDSEKKPPFLKKEEEKKEEEKAATLFRLYRLME